MSYISARKIVGDGDLPRVIFILERGLDIPAPVLSLVLDQSVYHTMVCCGLLFIGYLIGFER